MIITKFRSNLNYTTTLSKIKENAELIKESIDNAIGLSIPLIIMIAIINKYGN